MHPGADVLRERAAGRADDHEAAPVPESPPYVLGLRPPAGTPPVSRARAPPGGPAHAAIQVETLVDAIVS